MRKACPRPTFELDRFPVKPGDLPHPSGNFFLAESLCRALLAAQHPPFSFNVWRNFGISLTVSVTNLGVFSSPVYALVHRDNPPINFFFCTFFA